MSDQSTFNRLVNDSDFGRTHTPAGLDELHQLQAQRYLEQQIAQGSQPPPSWPEQQAAQARQQQMAQQAAAKQDAALRARQQMANYSVSKAAPAPRPQPGIQSSIDAFYGRKSKGKK